MLPIPFMLFYPVIQRRLGTVRMYQLVLSTFPIVVVFFPILNQLARAKVGEWTLNAALLGYFTAWSWCGLAWSKHVPFPLHRASLTRSQLALLSWSTTPHPLLNH
jgi:hypothetical protein